MRQFAGSPCGVSELRCSIFVRSSPGFRIVALCRGRAAGLSARLATLWNDQRCLRHARMVEGWRNMPSHDPDLRIRILAFAAIGVTVLAWGTSAAVIKSVSTSGVVTSVYRLTLGLPFLWAAPLLRPSLRHGITLPSLTAALVGGALFAAHQILYFNALKLTSVTNVSIIGALQPILVLLVAGPWFGERVTRRDVAWSAVALSGAMLVVVASKGAPSWSLQGDILAVINLVAFTAYFLVSKHYRTEMGATAYVVGMTTVAAIIMVSIALASGEHLASAHGSDWAWLFFLAMVPGTLGHVLSNWAHPHLPAFLISVMLLAVPVIAAVTAALFLGEPIHAGQVVGGAIVLGAIGRLVLKSPTVESDELAESVAETDAP